jgi:hypothetical protein
VEPAKGPDQNQNRDRNTEQPQQKVTAHCRISNCTIIQIMPLRRKSSLAFCPTTALPTRFAVGARTDVPRSRSTAGGATSPGWRPIRAIVMTSGIRVPHRGAGEEICVFAASCGKLHQRQTHRHSLCSIIFILQKMSNRLCWSQISTCGVFTMKKGNGPGGLAREERLQIMLSPEELKVVDSFRFRYRMPSRAAAVRELFRLGIAAAGDVVDNAGIKSSEYGVVKTPKNLTKLR